MGHETFLKKVCVKEGNRRINYWAVALSAELGSPLERPEDE